MANEFAAIPIGHIFTIGKLCSALGAKTHIMYDVVCSNIGKSQRNLIVHTANTWGRFYKHGLTLIPAWISSTIQWGIRLLIQRWGRWILIIDQEFHPTLYWTWDYSTMMGLKSINVRKGAPEAFIVHHWKLSTASVHAENGTEFIIYDFIPMQ